MIKEIIAFVFSKHFLKHLGLIMLFYVSVVLIMMVYLYFYTNHGEKIEVPNFVGMNSEKAKVVIEEKRIIQISQSCPRCNGQGYIPKYSHIENGRCFKCGGAKQISIRRVA